jgi:hypothetical protein
MLAHITRKARSAIAPSIPMSKAFLRYLSEVTRLDLYKAREFARLRRRAYSCSERFGFERLELRIDDTTPAPIDKFYNECIDQNGSTAGVSDCTRQAAINRMPRRPTRNLRT